MRRGSKLRPARRRPRIRATGAPLRAGPFHFPAYERASHSKRTLLVSKESATAKTGGGFSVYYPFALVELLDVRKTDEYEETGELLLRFRDADDCEVSVRLTPAALEQLCARLSQQLKP